MQKITVKDTSLFHLAATYLGSALQWINIARTNNISDPIIVGEKDVLLPPNLAEFGDGIGPQ